MTYSSVRILEVDNERKTLNWDPSLKFEGLQRSLETFPTGLLSVLSNVTQQNHFSDKVWLKTKQKNKTNKKTPKMKIKREV